MNNDLIYIYNKRQAFFYIKNGINPINSGVNKRTLKQYFIFSRSGTRKVYDLWCKQCEQYKKNK